MNEETERKIGHKGLRIKNGEIETFDPHPRTSEIEEIKEIEKRWVGKQGTALRIPFNEGKDIRTLLLHILTLKSSIKTHEDLVLKLAEDKHISHFEEKVKELESQIKPITYQKEMAEKENKMLWADIRNLEPHLKEITEKWKSLKFKVFDLEERVKKYTDDRSRLACEMSRLREQHHDDCARMIKLEEKVKELETALTYTKETSEMMAKAHREAESQIQLYKDENEQLRLNYNNLTDEYNKQNVRLKNAEAKISIYLVDIKNEQNISTELNERLQRLLEAVTLAIPCLEDWTVTTGFELVHKRDMEALELLKKVRDEK